MTSAEKVKERKIRRMLDRRGMKLHRCAARDKGHLNYGLYKVQRLGAIVKLWNVEWNSLDAVSLWLESSAERKGA